MIILFRSLCLKKKQKKFLITLPTEDVDKKLYLVKKKQKIFEAVLNENAETKKKTKVIF